MSDKQGGKIVDTNQIDSAIDASDAAKKKREDAIKKRTEEKDKEANKIIAFGQSIDAATQSRERRGKGI